MFSKAQAAELLCSVWRVCEGFILQPRQNTRLAKSSASSGNELFRIKMLIIGATNTVKNTTTLWIGPF